MKDKKDFYGRRQNNGFCSLYVLLAIVFAIAVCVFISGGCMKKREVVCCEPKFEVIGKDNFQLTYNGKFETVFVEKKTATGWTWVEGTWTGTQTGVHKFRITDTGSQTYRGIVAVANSCGKASNEIIYQHIK